MSTIGLDIGTTGCKAVVFSDQGETLGQAAREYAILTPQPGWAEQDAELVWQLAWEALSEAVSQSRGSTELTRQVYPPYVGRANGRLAKVNDPPKAMALSVQGEAIVPLDRNGNAIRNAILGMLTVHSGKSAFLCHCEAFRPKQS